MKRLLIYICMAALATIPVTSRAQWSGSASDRINTLRIIVNGDWERPAIITLGSDDRIEFS